MGKHGSVITANPRSDASRISDEDSTCMSDSMDWQNQADSRVEIKADEDEEIDVVGDTPDPLADYGKKLFQLDQALMSFEMNDAELCFRRD